MRIRDSKGFTLVETVITVAVVGMLLVVVANFAINSLQTSTTTTEQANLLGESQITMDRLISDVRLSAGAEQNNRWPDANNSSGSFAWASNASTLVLATAVTDKNNNIIFADASKYISEKNNIIYFVKNGVLYKRTLASSVANNSTQTSCPSSSASATCPADKQLLTNVTAFSIKYFNGDEQEVSPADARSIQVNVKTSVKKFSRTISSDYTTRAVFRND